MCAEKYNSKGIKFEHHGQPLAQIHHHCIQLFDFSMSDLQKNRQKDLDWEGMSQDDLMDVVANKELMHDNAAQTS